MVVGGPPGQYLQIFFSAKDHFKKKKKIGLSLVFLNNNKRVHINLRFSSQPALLSALLLITSSKVFTNMELNVYFTLLATVY